MKNHAQGNHRAKGILVVCMTAGLMVGCDDKAPPQQVSEDAKQGKPPVTKQVREEAKVDEQVPTASLGSASDQRKTESPEASGDLAPARDIIRDVSKLKQKLLQRGWREVPAEDGGTYLLPPGARP